VIGLPSKILLLNGALVLLAGLLAGAPMGAAINRKRAESVIRGWRVAHSGLTMGGIMLLAVALVVPHLVLSNVLVYLLVGAFVVSAYGFVVALPLGAWKGHRGLKSEPPGVNSIVYAGNLAGAYGSLLGTLILIYGAWRSL
jgi:hypothetical protein